MIIKIPGIDIEKAMDLFDDDEDILIAVLRSYISNTPSVLDRMRNVTAETLNNYATAVHGVKGTSTNIGAEELRKEAMELETKAKEGDLSFVQSRNEAFLKKADTLINDIQSWLNQYDAKS